MRALIEEAEPGCNADYLADVLMLALSPSAFAHHREARGSSLHALKAGYRDLVGRLLDPRPL